MTELHAQPCAPAPSLSLAEKPQPWPLATVVLVCAAISSLAPLVAITFPFAAATGDLPATWLWIRGGLLAAFPALVFGVAVSSSVRLSKIRTRGALAAVVAAGLLAAANAAFTIIWCAIAASRAAGA